MVRIPSVEVDLSVTVVSDKANGVNCHLGHANNLNCFQVSFQINLCSYIFLFLLLIFKK